MIPDAGAAAGTFLGHVRRRLSEARSIAGAPTGPAAAPSMPPDAFELLTVVRRYLVDEAGLPEAERRPRRERAIKAVSRAMGDSDAAGANANANAPRQAAAR